MSASRIPVFDKEELTFVCLSDTHDLISESFLETVPEGDILLHAGDFTNDGTLEELSYFNELMGKALFFIRRLHAII